MVSSLPLTRMVNAAAGLLLLLLCGSPALSQTTTAVVPKFVSGRANITLTNDTFTGRTTVIALTSPGDQYELSLIQDGFGTDTKFQYCWTEVHDTATGTTLTWRAPCNPLKVDACALVLTSEGDFRLMVAAGGSTTAAFVSDTGGEGLLDVHLTDDGDLQLVKADNTTVWQSSDHIQRQEKCKVEFVPSSSSHRTRFAGFGVACTISLNIIMALSH